MGLTIDVFVDGARSDVPSARVRSLTIINGVGHESDTATLAISVARPTDLVLPRIGVGISFAVALGRAPAETVGEALFTVGITGDSRSGTVTVEAEAVPPDSLLRQERDASWTGSSVGQIVSAIAERAGLIPAVSTMLAGVVPEGAIQAAESDQQFLGRLLNRLDGRMMVKGGRLVVLAAGENLAASGGTLPALVLDLDEDGSWVRYRRADPGIRGSVSARHYGADGSTIEMTIVGQGNQDNPKRRLPGTFPSKAAAESAAHRTLLKARASRDWIEVERHLTLDTRALYPLRLTGAPQGFATELTIQQVRHSIARHVARTTIRARP